MVARKAAPQRKPASTVEASGAIIKKSTTAAIPLDHPAIESDPRGGVPAEATQIDMNDPTLSAAEAVEQNLKAQG